MMKCKLFHVLLVATVAHFLLINITKAFVINQSSDNNEKRNQTNTNLSKTNSVVEESGAKEISKKEFINSPNIKKPNDIFYQKPHLSKLRHNERNKKNVITTKSTRDEKIKRQVHENNYQGKRGCKKFCYPLCCIQNINCKKDPYSDESIQSVHPQIPSYQFANYGYPTGLDNPNYYFYGNYDSQEYDENNLCDYEENFSSEEEDEEYIKKKIQTGEGGTFESKESTGKAIGITNNFRSSSEIKTQSFSELSISEQNILRQTVKTVFQEYSSTLKTHYSINNLNEIFQNSHVQTMLINAIRNLLEKNYEERSKKWITEEIIQSAMMDFVINDNFSKNNFYFPDKILVPIAEVSFKIGQRIHNKENHVSSKNEETQNTFNIETQITPLIQQEKLGNEISLTVSSKEKSKTKFSIEIENTNAVPSETDVINNLPTQYYLPDRKLLDYRRNNYQDVSGNGVDQKNYIPKNQNFPPGNQEYILNTERNTQEQNRFSESSSDKSNSQTENSVQRISNGINGNSQVFDSFRNQVNSESNRNSNTSRIRDFNEKTQFQELMRNKKHSDPGKQENFQKNNETTEKSIYKNPRIIALLVNDQKKFATKKNYFSTANENTDEKFQLLDEKNGTRDKNSRINDDNKNNKFVRSLDETMKVANDNFQKTSGIEKIAQIDKRNDFYRENVNDGNKIEHNLHSSELNSSESFVVAKSNKHLTTNHSSHRRNSYILGKLVPKNKENTEFMYEGKLLRLPLKLTKLDDGSFLVKLLNKIRNCSHKIRSRHSRNQSGFNTRDNGKKNEGKFLDKVQLFKRNSNDQEINTIKTKENLGGNSTSDLKENKKSEHEEYKQYLETLLDVNDIPKNDRSILITDAMDKKINSAESNLDMNKNYKNKKDGFKNMIKKNNVKPNKQNTNSIKYVDNINAAVDILKVVLNWLQNLILTTLNVKK